MLKREHIKRSNSLAPIREPDIPRAGAALRFMAMLELGTAVRALVEHPEPLALLGKPEEE